MNNQPLAPRRGVGGDEVAPKMRGTLYVSASSCHQSDLSDVVAPKMRGTEEKANCVPNKKKS